MLLLFSCHTQGAVFGDGDPGNGTEDQRRKATAEHLKPMGTLFCDGRLRGTAIHVRRPADKDLTSGSIILTAAHVLYDQKTTQPFKKCVYRPQNKRLTTIDITSLSSHRFNPKSVDKLQQAENDIVFIRLSKRLLQPTLTLTAVNKIPSALLLIAYNSGKNDISQSADCNQFVSQKFASKKLLLHDCDANNGSSGGAVLDAATGRLVGVHGGTFLVNNATLQRGKIPRGAKADPEKLINQARKINDRVIETLNQFSAYPAKYFQD
jgi:V8-like Glu-specific endopeptidase